ncbi:MAG TPA: enoyl-CoA hydratase-related protein [Stellaceae bacterium]|nr:enoyl-CoA hydratase-related protein [Stellaceae bacterium]
MTPYEFARDDALPAALDGFRVAWDEAHACAEIVLDRPPLNVVSMRQRDQLAAAFAALDRDPAVRIVVLRGEGKNFSSGGNIAGFLEASPEQLSHLADNVAAPERSGKPVIAAVRGYCFGVGFELALACDFRIASETAEFALPEMRIGMIPGSGGSARLAAMVGIARAKEIAMRSRRIKAREAADWGIVAECVPDAELEGAVARLAGELGSFSPLAQRTLKRVLNDGQSMAMGAAIALEGRAFGRLRSSADFKEGVASFVEKRKPVFRGD